MEIYGLINMVDREGLKLETELEIKNVEVEIKEKEVELYRNSYDSILVKEEIDEKLSKRKIEEIIEKAINEEFKYDFLKVKLLKLGALTYKNYCIEDEKMGLIGFKDNLIRKVEEIEDGYYGTESDVIDRIKKMDNL